jgi:hypothetical protein
MAEGEALGDSKGFSEAEKCALRYADLAVEGRSTKWLWLAVSLAHAERSAGRSTTYLR